MEVELGRVEVPIAAPASGLGGPPKGVVRGLVIGGVGEGGRLVGAVFQVPRPILPVFGGGIGPDGRLVEVQATAEGATYDEEGLLRLLRLARIGCDKIFAAQAKAVGR